MQIEILYIVTGSTITILLIIIFYLILRLQKYSLAVNYLKEQIG